MTTPLTRRQAILHNLLRAPIVIPLRLPILLLHLLSHLFWTLEEWCRRGADRLFDTAERMSRSRWLPGMLPVPPSEKMKQAWRARAADAWPDDDD